MKKFKYVVTKHKRVYSKESGKFEMQDIKTKTKTYFCDDIEKAKKQIAYAFNCKVEDIDIKEA